MLWKRRVTAIGIGLVLALLALEVVLQVWSYLAWSAEQNRDRPAGRVVLCVGDSLTYGLGATADDRSYPARLQLELREERPRWSVISGAWPGQSSADVLRRLPDQLARLRPDVVCVLVGWNDTWAKPLPIEDVDDADDGFPLRWRTGRLLALLGADVDAHLGADAAEDRPFLGAWHVGDHEFFFSPDGWAVVGGVTMPWRIEGDHILLTRDDGEVVPVRWRMAGSQLAFAIEGWQRFERARRGRAVDQTAIEAADDLLRAGRTADGIAKLEAELDGPHAPHARARLVEALVKAGREDEAAAHVAALRAVHANRRSTATAELLATSLQHCGANDEAVPLARECLRATPDRSACWRILIEAAKDPRSREIVADELEAALAAVTSPWPRALLLVEHAVAIAPLDAAAAIADLVAARQLGSGPDESMEALRRATTAGARAADLAGAIGHAAAEPAIRAALQHELHRTTATEDEVFEVLEQHLQSIVGRCREAGADVVLLGYPFRMPPHEAIVNRLAHRLEVPFVSLADRFAKELATSDRSAWFIDEIHCTDRGYALMAELVAPAIRDRAR